MDNNQEKQRRFLFRFKFHPSTYGSPSECEEIIEALDEKEARKTFEATWYRNISGETCQEVIEGPQKNKP